MLLVVPLIILAATYSLITRTLCHGIHDYKNHIQQKCEEPKEPSSKGEL
jgi:hypothetical protein